MKMERFHASKYGKGVKIAEGRIFVTGLKGPLEENWQTEVEAFASRITIPS